MELAIFDWRLNKNAYVNTKSKLIQDKSYFFINYTKTSHIFRVVLGQKISTGIIPANP